MELKYDIRELHHLAEVFNGRDVETALRWALNATSKKAATFISRDIRDVFAIKASDVKKHLDIQKYRNDATRALLYTGGKIPLEEFKPHQRRVRTKATSKRGKRFTTHRRGVSVRVRKDVGRQLVTGGWFAKGHVLRRQDRDNNKSEPIIQYGPSIPGMVAHPETMNEAQELVRRDLPQEFSNRLDYLLHKSGAIDF